MLRYSLIYGGIIGCVIIAFMVVVMLVLGTDNLAVSEVAGYAIMLVILSLVFIGIKRYRDIEHGGVVKFTQAAGVGIGIAVVSAFFYAVSWEGFLLATDYSFIDVYSQSQIDAIKAQGLSAAEEAARIAEVEQGTQNYRNPLFRMPITFIEIFPVGLVVALSSAAILRSPKVLPPRGNPASA